MAEPKRIDDKQSLVPLWDKEGKMKMYHFIDAKEIMAQKTGEYFRQPPEKAKAVEQQPVEEVKQDDELQAKAKKKKDD